jgi:2-polyprenyl-3-methyl-5-hydroxy-6-metoxy-1,4-benzoquinol methylase
VGVSAAGHENVAATLLRGLVRSAARTGSQFSFSILRSIAMKTSATEKEYYQYGKEYQLNQAEKYRSREKNHWKIRIELA